MWLSLSNDMTSAMEHVVTSFVVGLVIVGHFVTNISACDVNCAGLCAKYGGNTCDSVCKANYGVINFACKPCTAVGCNSPCNSGNLAVCDGTSCDANYVWTALAKACKPCDAHCTGGCATKGGLHCDGTCATGYSLSSTFYCVACDPNCAGACTKGAGKCDSTCKAGYSLSGTFTCIKCDVNCQGGCVTKGATYCDATCKANYALTTTFTCAACDAHCTNGCAVKKAPNCDGTCMTGWSWNPNTFLCVDINECATPNGGCAAIPTATCTNNPGSRTCACNTGYVGNGITCAACDANCAGACTKGAGKCDALCKANYKLLTPDYTCGLIVDGVWSDPPTQDNTSCTPAALNAKITETKNCDNPAPANGGLECLKEDGVTRALVETTSNLPCPCGTNCAAAPDGCATNGADKCDDGQCDTTQSVYDSTTKTCVSTCDPECDTTTGCVDNGPGNCDGTCNAGFEYDPSDFKCHAPIDGNWGAEVVTECTVFGQASLIRHRDCNNPAPKYGGALCTDIYGVSATTEDIQTDCPCDEHCDPTATCTGGYGTCDEPCITGYGIETSNATCQPSIDGHWSDWSVTTECTALYDPSHIETRNCDSPMPAYGGAECEDSAGQFALTETNTTACPCDEHCVPESGCDGGFMTCGTVCIAGWGLEPDNATCQECDPLCTGPCNINGPGACDGPCEFGYGVHPTSHFCEQCDLLCNGTCDEFGANTCDGPCEADYGVHPTSHLCRPCDLHCAELCDNQGAGRCDGTCDPGYVLKTSTNMCAKCGANCTLASGCLVKGPARCDTACDSHYVLDSESWTTPTHAATYTCLPCQTTCGSECTASGPYKCDGACVAGYVNINNLCQPCDPRCELAVGSCNTKLAGKCDATCAPPYVLSQTFTCGSCSSNCIGGCTSEGAGFCDPCSSNPCVMPYPCATGYGIKKAINAGTATNQHACYPCAANCNSQGCNVQGGSCCDPATTQVTQPCIVGTWTLSATADSPDCHICN